MERTSLSEAIADQTARALWEVGNVIACVPDELWDKAYCEMPLWKHIYHMLHSLDLWFVNPCDPGYEEPPFHEEDMNDLDVKTEARLSRAALTAYFARIEAKIKRYTGDLRDDALLQKPEGCAYSRFTLMLAQHRHLHTHMGMLMGFLAAETGRWPRVVGLQGEIPAEARGVYF